MFNYFNGIISTVNNTETESFAKQILIYPNPSSGVFNIDFSELQYKEINLQIFDVLGQQPIKAPIKPFNSTTTIDLTSLPNGAYFIKATIDGKTAQGRIYKTE